MVEGVCWISVTDFTFIDLGTISYFVLWEVYTLVSPWLKKNVFLALEQGDILVAAYEAKFHALSHHSTQLLTTEEKRIWLYVKGLNDDL